MMTVLYFLKISKNTNYSDGFILLTISGGGQLKTVTIICTIREYIIYRSIYPNCANYRDGFQLTPPPEIVKSMKPSL